ncbi:MAG TPA: hypothetical protein VMA95_11735 [Streptosporangiaceae bacterium]|nr:hypothetical protein [Streptosporangiaceae bacterium]
MSQLPHALSLLAASAHYLGNIPNPPPASPGPGGGAIATLLAWTKWIALAACAGSAVAAGGMIAVGSVSHRADLAARGKAGLLWAVGGAIVVAIGIPLVNHAFSLG